MCSSSRPLTQKHLRVLQGGPPARIRKPMGCLRNTRQRVGRDAGSQQAAWPIALFEDRWREYPAGLMSLLVLKAGSTSTLRNSIPDALEQLHKCQLVAQHIQITDHALNILTVVHSPSLLQPVPAPPASLPGLFNVALGMRSLQTVVMEVQGLSFSLSAADLETFAKSWSNLKVLRLRFTLSRLEDAPTLSTISRVARLCPQLEDLELPALNTADCAETLQTQQTPRLLSMLMNLMFDNLLISHPTETVIDALLHLFPSIQSVSGLGSHHIYGQSKDLEQGLQDRLEHEACNAAILTCNADWLPLLSVSAT
ncbi:hypothetical protein OH77DRAFT_160287 [Trametes cingulata]|nr:hypothetical protein OH77DRAFT_160287 [Trametes cingulata]